MTLTLAQQRLTPMVKQPFSTLLTPAQLAELSGKNKGSCGHILETLLDVPHTNHLTDCPDGEIKTFPVDSHGKPKETAAIRQITGDIDDILDGQPFFESNVWRKIQRTLYISVCKEGKPENWYIYNVCLKDLNEPQYATEKNQLHDDWVKMREDMIAQITTGKDGMLHTVNGEFIQIRTKDSFPYRPIISRKYGCISNKGRAVFFKKPYLHGVANIA